MHGTLAELRQPFAVAGQDLSHFAQLILGVAQALHVVEHILHGTRADHAGATYLLETIKQRIALFGSSTSITCQSLSKKTKGNASRAKL